MIETNALPTTEIRLIRLSEVIQRTGLSRSTIYLLISRNQFPRPVHISERAVAWSSIVVQSWIEAKLKGSA